MPWHNELGSSTKNNGPALRDMPQNTAAGCFLQGMKKWWRRTPCNTAACHFLPWHEPWHKERCNATPPQHEEVCCGTKLFHDTKSFAVAWRALPRHKPWHKNIIAAQNAMQWHEEYGRSTNNKHQPRQVDCFLNLCIWIFSPKTVLVCCGRLLQFSDRDTISMCAQQPPMQKEKKISYMNYLRNTW